MKTRFLEIADWELAESILYYENERPGLGTEFHAEVDSALDRIESNKCPWRGRASREMSACAVPNGFRTGWYQIRGDEALIIAVMHLHRRPGYWRKRLMK